MLENGYWIIFLEAGVALSLLLIIVWATWPKQKKTSAQPAPEAVSGGSAEHSRKESAPEGSDEPR